MPKRLRAILAIAFTGVFLTAQAASAATETAIFAGGCFWSMQHGMEGAPGVVKVVAGYTGGHVANPTYAQVSSESSGHYESVEVTFDPDKISYADLVAYYFHLTDPTDGRGQFCDQGSSYRPAIFVADDAQRATAEAVKVKIAAELRGHKVATTILPAHTFWPAETYHQDYALKNPAAYAAYRVGCGRDAALAAVWRR